MLMILPLLCALSVSMIQEGSAAPPRRMDHGLDYLYKYGYLPKEDKVMGKVRPMKDIRKATRMLQKFMKMPMTGDFDDATMDMMKKPRCGNQDMDMKDSDFYDDLDKWVSQPSKRDRHHGRRHNRRHGSRAAQINIAPSEFRLLPGEPRWDKYHITYSYDNYTPKLPREQVRDAVERAFKLWSDATLLSFSEVTDSRIEADIKLKFGTRYHGDSYPFDDGGSFSGNVLAHAFPPGPGLQGDVHFDDYETWSYEKAGDWSSVDLHFVAVHEIGHALGLGHSEVLGSIMFPSYSGYKPNLQLHGDDRIIIQYLYGVNEGKEDTTTTTTTTTTTPTPPTTTLSEETAPNPCVVGIDAAVLAHMGEYEQSEIFMFKGPWFWRRSFTSMMEVGLIRNKWSGLPHHLTHVDAVYQNPRNNKLTFFSGDRYWEFNYLVRDDDTPVYGRPITDLGLPRSLEKIDAVFTWARNGRSYVVSGQDYWGLDEVTGQVKADYPKDMSMWEGVPTPLDAAFQLWDGRTYFFKDQDFFVFNDRMMSVEQTVEGQMGRYWLWCTPE